MERYNDKTRIIGFGELTEIHRTYNTAFGKRIVNLTTETG